jgi:hypothetical protein
VATNRFYGALITPEDRDNAEFFGITGAKLNTLKVEGRLSEQGAGVDFDFGEDYSGTAAWCCYKATAEMVIYKMVLHLNLSTFTASAAIDSTLFMGGAAALTNGIVWGVSTLITNTTPNQYGSSGAKSISELSSVHGADFTRNYYSVDATAGDNSDDVTVVYNFVHMYGFPIKLMKGQNIGIFLSDNLSAVTSITGKVFGRLIYD